MPTQTSPTVGGYPCCTHLKSGLVEGSVPMVGTTLGTTTPFTGDYRAARFTTVGAFLKVNSTNRPLAAVRPSLVLYSANGTPADPSDDWGAFTMYALSLPPVGQWQMFTFGIPSQATALPAGWTIVRFGAGAPANPDWNSLIQSVDRLAFAYGNTSQPGKGQSWDVSFDYVFISDRLNCYPNCDGSTLSPCMNAHDFACFLNKFANADPYANCDGSTTFPVYTVGDFGCFLMAWASGCSAC